MADGSGRPSLLPFAGRTPRGATGRARPFRSPTGRSISGADAERWGLVSLAVAPDDLETTVDKIADEVAEVPPHGMLENKEALNTDLEMMGVTAMFRLHGQHNAMGRIVRPAVGFGEGVQKPEPPKS